MESFGERMRREREKRKISLEDISEASKISLRSLQALERDEFDKLPGGIFNKGFVRSYARQLGMDEDQAVAEFVAAAGSRELPLPDPVVPRSAQVPRIREKPQWQGAALRVLLLVLLVAVAWKVVPSGLRRVSKIWTAYSERKPRAQAETIAPAPVPPVAERPASPAVTASGGKKNLRAKPVQLAEISRPAPAASIPAPARAVRSAAPVPAATPAKTALTPAQTVATPANTTPATREFVVRVRALRDTRVQVVADGQVIQDGLLVANTVRRFRAKQEMVLKAEKAAAVEVSFNDKVLPPLGGENQVATVRITSAGLQR